MYVRSSTTGTATRRVEVSLLAKKKNLGMDDGSGSEKESGSGCDKDGDAMDDGGGGCEKDGGSGCDKDGDRRGWMRDDSVGREKGGDTGSETCGCRDGTGC